MPDFPASDLQIGYRLASGDTVMVVSTVPDTAGRIIQVTTQNGTRFTNDYPADAVFFNVDTTFYDQLREGAT